MCIRDRFRPLYVILQIWQTCGYYGIIYMAAIMSIDPSIYEAASVDGASRWQKMMKITLPGIKTTVVVMLIVAVGNIFSVDLDRILLMYNPSVYETADVLQTYVYRLSFQSTGFPDYGYATAVNMVKSVIAFLLVLSLIHISAPSYPCGRVRIWRRTRSDHWCRSQRWHLFL